MPTAVEELVKDADEDLLAHKGGPPPPPDDEDNEGDGEGDDDGDDDDEEQDDDGPWVTAATFWQPPAVHVARLRLEGAGVPTLILDENLIATDWLLANAAGGIKLQVPAARLAEARRLLHLPPPQESDEPRFDGQSRCPRCGSDRIHVERLSRRLIFLSILLLGAPLPIFRRHMHCQQCNHSQPM